MTNFLVKAANFDQKPHFWGLYWAAKVNKFTSRLIKTTKVKDNPPIYEFKIQNQNSKPQTLFRISRCSSKFHKIFLFHQKSSHFLTLSAGFISLNIFPDSL